MLKPPCPNCGNDFNQVSCKKCGYFHKKRKVKILNPSDIDFLSNPGLLVPNEPAPPLELTDEQRYEEDGFSKFLAKHGWIPAALTTAGWVVAMGSDIPVFWAAILWLNGFMTGLWGVVSGRSVALNLYAMSPVLLYMGVKLIT